MQDTWEYIEAYFTQALGTEEKKTFEMRCEQDEAFAKEVAFYLTARSAAREALMEQKQKAFAATDEMKITTAKEVTATKVKKTLLRQWVSYAAAACIILFVGSYFIFFHASPHRLAARYIKDKYTILGQTMGTSGDSLQLGIAAYNSKDYRRALVLFEGVRQNNPASEEAKKYAGLAYLQTNNYDKALECFKELSAMPGLYSNNGDFLQAVTFLHRNQPGDKESAKALLQQVVAQNKEGSPQAKEWLEKW